MASPFVTGMVALYKQAYPSLKGPSIRTYMQKSALDLGKKGKDANMAMDWFNYLTKRMFEFFLM